MIKAILFDLDNTLIDFMRMKQKSCEAAVNAMISAGLKASKKKALKELFVLYDKYGLEHRNIFEKLLKKINGKVDYRIVTHGIIAYRKLRESYLSAYPGTRPVLRKLKKNHKLAIISDAPRRNAWFRLVALRIDQFFDVVITSGDVKSQKNTFTPFRAALKKLKIQPEEALMVGDRIDRDINTPKKLGIQTCYARYGAEKYVKKGKSGADFEIQDITELVGVVEGNLNLNRAKKEVKMDPEKELLKQLKKQQKSMKGRINKQIKGPLVEGMVYTDEVAKGKVVTKRPDYIGGPDFLTKDIMTRKEEYVEAKANKSRVSRKQKEFMEKKGGRVSRKQIGEIWG